MADYFAAAVLVLSVILIYKSSGWVIRYSVLLSRLLGISTVVVGFVLLAVSTSLPELLVTLFAAVEGEMGFGMGNILGSNMLNVNFITALAVLSFGAFRLGKGDSQGLVEMMLIASTVTLVVLSIPWLWFLHGIVLITIFGVVALKIYHGGRVEKETVEKGEIPIPEESRRLLGLFRRDIPSIVVLKFVFSVSVLLAASRLLVDSSITLAGIAGVSATLVGATIAAAGTSLPEVSTTLAAVRRRNYGLAMGNLTGSAVANVTLVLGALAVVSPAPIAMGPYAGMMPFLLLSGIYAAFLLFRGSVTRFQAAVLLALYAAFLMEQAGLAAFFGA